MSNTISVLQPDDQLMQLLETYHSIVTEDDNQFKEKLSWCLENCQDKFRDIRSHSKRVWYFQNPKDATMFAMKWA
jgi:uncharacterized protein (DUF427 family)